MPNVPYQPIPEIQRFGRTITPGTGAGAIHVDTPRFSPEQFGGQVGQALQHFGTVSEETGQELFNRAEAFKKLDNSNDATNAAIDAEKSQTELLNQLKQKEGKNAVDAYDGFDDQLEAIRQAHRARLTNPDAQHEFDIMSRNSQNRLFAQGASYAGTQHRAWTDATNKTAVATAAKNVSLMPTERATIDSRMDDLATTVKQQYADAGLSDDAMAQHVHLDQSTALRGAFERLAQVDPTTAGRLLKSYQDKMEQDDWDAAKQKIDGYYNQVVPRGIVADLMAGRNYSLGDVKVPIERARNAIGGYESDNKYNGKPGPLTAHGHALGRYQVMEEFLPDYLKEAGMAPMTAQEFLNNPGAQDELFTKVFQKRMDQYGSFNEAASRWFTGKSIDEARAKGRHDVFGTNVDRYLANTNARLATTASPIEMTAAGQVQGQKLDPNGEHPLLPQFLDHAIRTQLDINAQKKREMAQEFRDQILHATSTPDKDGRYLQTVDELWADPANKRAWDNLSQPEQTNILARMHNNIVKGYELTPEKEARFMQLKGMLATADGKAKFQDIDLTAEHLPNNLTLQLMQKFHEVKAQWGQDEPSTTHINQAYGTLLNSAGIKKNSDEYYQFVGAAQGAWDAYYEQYKKPPDAQTKAAIGAQLLQEHAASGLSRFWGGKDVMYQTIPDEYREQITKDLTSQYGATPQESQIRREYFTQLYNAMFQEGKGKGDRAAATAPVGPAAPASR